MLERASFNYACPPPFYNPCPFLYLLTLEIVYSSGTSLLLAYQNGNGLVEIVSLEYKYRKLAIWHKLCAVLMAIY